MEKEYYQIDEVSKLTGLTKRTIRYYEELELFKPVRTDSSYRLYTDEDVETIIEIKNLRVKFGMNCVQVKHFMGLRRSIQEILNDQTQNIEKIRETEDKIKELMIFVDERETLLIKIKNNCNNYLDALAKKHAQSEDCQNEK